MKIPLGFDEWYDEYSLSKIKEPECVSCVHYANAAWSNRQIEIDELQKEIKLMQNFDKKSEISPKFVDSLKKVIIGKLNKMQENSNPWIREDITFSQQAEINFEILSMDSTELRDLAVIITVEEEKEEV